MTSAANNTKSMQMLMAIAFIKNNEALEFRVSINLTKLHHLGHKIANAHGPVLKSISNICDPNPVEKTTGLHKQQLKCSLWKNHAITNDSL